MVIPIKKGILTARKKETKPLKMEKTVKNGIVLMNPNIIIFLWRYL